MTCQLCLHELQEVITLLEMGLKKLEDADLAKAEDDFIDAKTELENLILEISKPKLQEGGY